MPKTIKKKMAVTVEEKQPKELLSRNTLAGGYLPPALADKFSLYTVYHGLSRSHVIYNLVEKEMLNAPSNPEMIDNIAKRMLVLKADKISMDRYKITVSRQLDKKKLSVEQIEAITTRMEEIVNGSKKEKTDTK